MRNPWQKTASNINFDSSLSIAHCTFHIQSMKPVYILGISCYYHDSAVALLKDGEIYRNEALYASIV